MLNSALARGIADVDEGRVKPLAMVKHRLVTKYEAEASARRVKVIFIDEAKVDLERIGDTKSPFRTPR